MAKDTIGPTGDFPDGKMRADDEGAIRMGATVYEGKVVLNFGTPITWIGLHPQEAADLATLLLDHARRAAKESGTVITMKV